MPCFGILPLRGATKVSVALPETSAVRGHSLVLFRSLSLGPKHAGNLRMMFMSKQLAHSTDTLKHPCMSNPDSCGKKLPSILTPHPHAQRRRHMPHSSPRASFPDLHGQAMKNDLDRTVLPSRCLHPGFFFQNCTRKTRPAPMIGAH